MDMFLGHHKTKLFLVCVGGHFFTFRVFSEEWNIFLGLLNFRYFWGYA